MDEQLYYKGTDECGMTIQHRQRWEVDEQLCLRTPEEQCHTISDEDTSGVEVDEATENVVEDTGEGNSDAADCEDASKDVEECDTEDIDELGDQTDATCPSKADLKGDEDS